MALVEDALATLWNNIIGGVANGIVVAIPAVLVLVIGYIVGKVLGKVTKEILMRANVDKYISKEEHVSIEVSSIASLIVRWLVYLVTIAEAARISTLVVVQDAVWIIVTFASQVILAAATIIAGYSLALYIKERVITSKTSYSNMTGNIVFGLVLYLSIAIGLKFITVVDTSIIDQLLLVIVGAVGIGIAIALGLGLKDVVAREAEQYIKEGGKGRKR
ncbi:hypothetical protein D4Q76_00390 [archaeon]|nr:MAG: hypothetical protein D4Q76_00390 [archaeon]